MNPPFRIPTPEETAQTHTHVQSACAKADKVIQALDELVEWFERENQLPAMRGTGIARACRDK